MIYECHKQQLIFALSFAVVRVPRWAALAHTRPTGTPIPPKNAMGWYDAKVDPPCTTVIAQWLGTSQVIGQLSQFRICPKSLEFWRSGLRTPNLLLFFRPRRLKNIYIFSPHFGSFQRKTTLLKSIFKKLDVFFVDFTVFSAKQSLRIQKIALRAL